MNAAGPVTQTCFLDCLGSDGHAGVEGKCTVSNCPFSDIEEIPYCLLILESGSASSLCNGRNEF